jgi:hypothetical protein
MSFADILVKFLFTDDEVRNSGFVTQHKNYFSLQFAVYIIFNLYVNEV